MIVGVDDSILYGLVGMAILLGIACIAFVLFWFVKVPKSAHTLTWSSSKDVLVAELNDAGSYELKKTKAKPEGSLQVKSKKHPIMYFLARVVGISLGEHVTAAVEKAVIQPERIDGRPIMFASSAKAVALTGKALTGLTADDQSSVSDPDKIIKDMEANTGMLLTDEQKTELRTKIADKAAKSTYGTVLLPFNPRLIKKYFPFFINQAALLQHETTWENIGMEKAAEKYKDLIKWAAIVGVAIVIAAVVVFGLTLWLK